MTQLFLVSVNWVGFTFIFNSVQLINIILCVCVCVCVCACVCAYVCACVRARARARAKYQKKYKLLQKFYKHFFNIKLFTRIRQLRLWFENEKEYNVNISRISQSDPVIFSFKLSTFHIINSIQLIDKIFLYNSEKLIILK